MLIEFFAERVELVAASGRSFAFPDRVTKSLQDLCVPREVLLTTFGCPQSCSSEESIIEPL